MGTRSRVLAAGLAAIVCCVLTNPAVAANSGQALDTVKSGSAAVAVPIKHRRKPRSGYERLSLAQKTAATCSGWLSQVVIAFHLFNR